MLERVDSTAIKMQISQEQKARGVMSCLIFDALFETLPGRGGENYRLH